MMLIMSFTAATDFIFVPVAWTLTAFTNHFMYMSAKIGRSPEMGSPWLNFSETVFIQHFNPSLHHFPDEEY